MSVPRHLPNPEEEKNLVHSKRLRGWFEGLSLEERKRAVSLVDAHLTHVMKTMHERHKKRAGDLIYYHETTAPDITIAHKGVPRRFVWRKSNYQQIYDWNKFYAEYHNQRNRGNKRTGRCFDDYLGLLDRRNSCRGEENLHTFSTLRFHSFDIPVQLLEADRVLENAVLLCDTREYSDTMTLSDSLLSNAKEFFRIMNLTTRNGFLSKPCRVVRDYQRKTWEWEEPKWFADMGFTKFSTWVASNIETVLWMHYWRHFKMDPRRQPDCKLRYNWKLDIMNDQLVSQRHVYLYHTFNQVFESQNFTIYNYNKLLPSLFGISSKTSTKSSNDRESRARQFVEFLFFSPLPRAETKTDLMIRKLGVSLKNSFLQAATQEILTSSSKSKGRGRKMNKKSNKGRGKSRKKNRTSHSATPSKGAKIKPKDRCNSTSSAPELPSRESKKTGSGIAITKSPLAEKRKKQMQASKYKTALHPKFGDYPVLEEKDDKSEWKTQRSRRRKDSSSDFSPRVGLLQAREAKKQRSKQGRENDKNYLPRVGLLSTQKKKKAEQRSSSLTNSRKRQNGPNPRGKDDELLPRVGLYFTGEMAKKEGQPIYYSKQSVNSFAPSNKSIPSSIPPPYLNKASRSSPVVPIPKINPWKTKNNAPSSEVVSPKGRKVDRNKTPTRAPRSRPRAPSLPLPPQLPPMHTSYPNRNPIPNQNRMQRLQHMRHYPRVGYLNVQSYGRERKSMREKSEEKARKPPSNFMPGVGLLNSAYTPRYLPHPLNTNYLPNIGLISNTTPSNQQNGKRGGKASGNPDNRMPRWNGHPVVIERSPPLSYRKPSPQRHRFNSSTETLNPIPPILYPSDSESSNNGMAHFSPPSPQPMSPRLSSSSTGSSPTTTHQNVFFEYYQDYPPYPPSSQAVGQIPLSASHGSEAEPGFLPGSPTPFVGPSYFYQPGVYYPAPPSYYDSFEEECYYDDMWVPESIHIPLEEPDTDIANTLHDAILAFVRRVDKKLKSKAKEKKVVVKNIESLVKELWPENEIKVEVYGSFVTGLAIPPSDVDIVVVGTPQQKGAANKSLLELSYELQWQDWVQEDSVECIESATVPVIKFETNSGIQFDITLQDSAHSHSGVRARDLLKKMVANFPELRPLALVIKTLLHEHELNHPYRGGLSSYCLVLMIICFLQSYSTNTQAGSNDGLPNLGSLLIKFLDLYGNKLEYERIGITIHHGFLPLSEELPPTYPLVVQDPFNAENNIGKICYMMSSVKSLFHHYYIHSQTTLLQTIVYYYGKRDWSLGKRENNAAQQT